MSARDNILGRVRRSLGVSGDDAARRAAVANRLAEAKSGLIPARGQLPREERIEIFAKYARNTVRRSHGSDPLSTCRRKFRAT